MAVGADWYRECGRVLAIFGVISSAMAAIDLLDA